MADELENLGGITLTDDSFGIDELDFADSLLIKPGVKPEDITTIEEAKKKEEEAERIKKEAALKSKAPEKKDLTTEDLLGKDKDEDNPEDIPKDEDDVDDSQFENLSKGLVKLGIFSEEGDLPKTGEELAERFQIEKQKGASDWINNFLSSEHGEEGIALFKAIFVDKVDPREYLSVHNEILNLQDLDIENEINQKKVFREFYKNLGWDDVKIESKLQKSIDYGDLESDSKEYFEALKEQKEEQRATIEENKKIAAEQELQEDTIYKTTIVKVLEEKLKTKDFDGIPLNPEKARKVIDFLTTKKYQTKDKQRLTEYDKYMLESRKPENIRTRILTALLALDNFNFDSIKKRAITTETDGVFSELKQKTKTTTKPDKKQTDWFANSL